ncbi:MAG: alpha/beta hydrolase [Actinomycetota bacterium]|nr:alpha/beta hydrolase [Actinomycetota bacterium]
MSDEFGFTHRFVAGSDATTLLLLHGTGGNESDLLGLGRALAPGANLLSPRGKVLENGMPRFFRRLAMGVFDVEDLKARTHELASFVEDAAGAYEFDRARIVAVGYSNGANIAASLLLLRPGLLRAAALLHAMVPFEPDELPDLSASDVLLTAGRHDPMVPQQHAERLAQMLARAGANVSVEWQAGGHELGPSEIESVKNWLTKLERNL